MRPIAILVALSTGLPIGPAAGRADGPAVEIPEEVLADKIQGGLLGQLFGNLNGLPHELKYNDAPGNVPAYVPSLPEGARTDDDTDIEWVYIVEMQKSGELLIPPGRITDLWRAHINTHIWCANEYARRLMDLGFDPPLTGRLALNPWSSFNISGQFVCEAFGLIAPGLPQTASRIGLHYTHVAIDGEPAQATQLFDTMIATAFIETDVQRIVSAGLAAVDPKCNLRQVVQDVRQWQKDNPDDWRKTWHAIHDKYARHGGMRDFNGHELNTAAVIGALLYAKGDFVETVRLSFNFGWDADCNAATAGTIVGVTKGRRWMESQGWTIRDLYRNLTRPGMPDDETITRYGDRLVEVARKVIRQRGGTERMVDGKKIIRILTEQPLNIESVARVQDRLEQLRADRLEAVGRELTGRPQERARAAYLALCLGESQQLAKDRPEQWRQAVAALKGFPKLIEALFKAPKPSADDLQARARAAGLEPPQQK
jgi:hypothetical protein